MSTSRWNVDNVCIIGIYKRIHSLFELYKGFKVVGQGCRSKFLPN